MTATAQAAPLDITGAWFRALPGKLPAGGYFTAQNNTRRDIAITGARSDGCGTLMIHESSNKGGMTGMAMVERVNVPAGGKIAFAPGGYHLMCESPTPKMKIGAKVPVLLNLSDGTAVAVAFAVRGATGK
jgi:periplasmic copper chaperone A